ncbi:telomerase Cajal body protein 1-like [Triticum dicoccoides]|uniref:telomerase Cajal body protein 1-like n=1 Tax=Triticum dicoccoides TaxID=85692 RepID=UPI00188EE604|nr:telomerase Cajal body protein 1-like [Triticum dicoccoides]XP_044367419.1 telomerase Cajal body protein 1-like [Triticum aestivum]
MPYKLRDFVIYGLWNESYSSDFCQTLPILCVRNPFIRLYRSCDTTNQRVQFDIEPCGKHLATGGQDGVVHIYDLQGGQWVTGFQAAADTVNGFSFHPYLPLATTSSGHRRFGMQDEFEEESSLAGDENCCSVWKFSCSQES